MRLLENIKHIFNRIFGFLFLFSSLAICAGCSTFLGSFDPFGVPTVGINTHGFTPTSLEIDSGSRVSFINYTDQTLRLCLTKKNEECHPNEVNDDWKQKRTGWQRFLFWGSSLASVKLAPHQQTTVEFSSSYDSPYQVVVVGKPYIRLTVNVSDPPSSC